MALQEGRIVVQGGHGAAALGRDLVDEGLVKRGEALEGGGLAEDVGPLGGPAGGLRLGHERVVVAAVREPEASTIWASG